MKYFVFTVAALGVPPLAFLINMNRRWLKYAFWAMIAAMCVYIPTSINFFSHELYRGSARGMEVSVVYLFAASVLIAIAMRRKFPGFFPGIGAKLFLFYFLLCLPSWFAAENRLFCWFETWKMVMLHFTYLSVYAYLAASDDVKSIVKGLAWFAITNLVLVAKDHLAGVYQPHGVFPHQNGLAVAMHLFGTLFFAHYITNGVRTRYDKLLAFAFVCAAAVGLRTYSRGAIAMIPISYAIVAWACIFKGKVRARRWVKRLAPLAFIGAIALAVILPRIIERFITAPEASGQTRIQLALCAKEMIKDKPWTGVGINNWGIKINPPYEYAERAGRFTNRDEDFRDGIVETVYLLVGAECGIPALVAMLLWFAYYWIVAFRLLRKLAGTRYFYIPAGILGGLSAIYLQSCLEWVLRMQLNLIILLFFFAMLEYLNHNWRKLRNREAETLKKARLPKGRSSPAWRPTTIPLSR